MSRCLTLNIKKTRYSSVLDKKLRELGFEYATEYMTFLIYRAKVLEDTFYIECLAKENNNTPFYSYSFFRIRKEEDTYAKDVLIPCLVEHYGKYEEVDFDLSEIYNEKTGIVKAKLRELDERLLYLLEEHKDLDLEDYIFVDLKNREDIGEEE